MLVSRCIVLLLIFSLSSGETYNITLNKEELSKYYDRCVSGKVIIYFWVVVCIVSQFTEHWVLQYQISQNFTMSIHDVDIGIVIVIITSYKPNCLLCSCNKSYNRAVWLGWSTTLSVEVYKYCHGTIWILIRHSFTGQITQKNGSLLHLLCDDSSLYQSLLMALVSLPYLSVGIKGLHYNNYTESYFTEQHIYECWISTKRTTYITATKMWVTINK